MKLNIMIVGVGGQGTLLTSRILGHTLMAEGLDVKVSEVHGMSQRGGSVVTYVRCGDRVYSPLIGEGEADYILAFEELEALRALPCLKKDGTLLMNTQRIDPMPVITGAAVYPDGIEDTLRSQCRLITADALSLAIEAGNSRCANVVLVGLLARQLPIPRDRWEQAIRETVPARFLEVNLAAFARGYELQG